VVHPAGFEPTTFGSTLLGLCPSCRGETYLERVPDGWKCPDCDHVNEGRFRAPVRSRRTIDTRRGIALCEAGYSCHRAAKTLGCSPGMLKRAMQRAGFTPRLHKPTNPGRPTTRRLHLRPIHKATFLETLKEHFKKQLYTISKEGCFFIKNKKIIFLKTFL
jgi:hypothetical protein